MDNLPNIVHNIGQMKDCSHLNSIWPILLVNIGPILFAILAKYCASVNNPSLAQYFVQYCTNIVGKYWSYTG